MMGLVDNFEIQDCVDCGVRFGVPVGFTINRRNDKRSFYCPNGHPMSYRESTADVLRRERDRLKQQLAQKDDEAAEAFKKLAKTEKEMKRQKKRIESGLCTCCNRHFSNLQRHMENKHNDHTNHG
jgi:hypothetical protein